MTDLPIAHAWDDIQPGIESVVGTKITGWRTGIVLTTVQVTPFDFSSIAASQCNREVLGREAAALTMHTGEKVHPFCFCGLHFCRTRDQALAYFHRMYKEGHVSLQRNVFMGIYYGHALCKISLWPGEGPWPGVHVTGAPVHPETASGLDPAWVARSNAIELEEIQLFDNVPLFEEARLKRYYRGVEVTRVEGSLRDAAAAAAAEISPYVTGESPVRFGMVGAAHMALHRDGHILLARRSEMVHDEVGKWGLPGGARGDGESYLRCALRETQEETGLNVAPTEITTRHKITTIENTWRHITYVTDYSGAGTLGTDLAPDSAATEWMPLDAINRLIDQGGTTRDLAREWPEILDVLTGGAL